MTDRDEELGQEAARKGKDNAGDKQTGGQGRDRGKDKSANGDRPDGRGRGQGQGQNRGQNQGQNQGQNRDHAADQKTDHQNQPSSETVPDQAARAGKRQGQNKVKNQDQHKARNSHSDHEQDPVKTAVSAEDKEQARNARRSANQLARAAARAERQAERASRKQDRGQTKAARDDAAQPAKDVEIAKKNRDLPSNGDHDRGDADRKAQKKSGQGKKDRNASPQPVGFARFAPAPALDSPASMPSPAGGLVIPPEDVEAAPFNILLIGQSGGLARQAVIFAASLRIFSPKWRGRLIVAEPQPDGAWSGVSTRIDAAERALLQGYGAEILPFTAQHFGRAYPYGNKIEALALLPAGEPFVFFDSDTIITGPLGPCAIDFSRPTASMRREGSWPEPPLYGPGYADIWRSLYDRFGLDFASSLDPDQPDEHWERYLYFNAGWFLGDDPVAFATRFLDWALAVRNEPGEALASQSLDPWLDQAVLPLVIHALGGGRPGAGLDGFDNGVTCHYRNLSLLYAREPDSAIVAMEQVLALPELRDLFGQDAACDRLVYQRGGRDSIRPIFAGKPLPSKEKTIRQELKKQGLWFGR